MFNIDRNLLKTPSFITLIVTGFIILFIILMLLFSKESFTNLTYYNKLVLLSLFAIVIGVHGLLHLGMEIQYKYNPLKNNISEDKN
jgi:hypothetical protein